MTRRMILPLLFGLAGCAILIALGSWQMQRLAWKQAILAQISARLADTPVALPVVPPGSVLLVDYKTAHAGRANRSDLVRPIVCLAYGRPWFRDVINHRTQPPLRFKPGFVATAPKKVLDLVGWWHRDLQWAQTEV